MVEGTQYTDISINPMNALSKLMKQQEQWFGMTNEMRTKGKGATPNEWKKVHDKE